MTRREQALGLLQQLDAKKKMYKDAYDLGCRSAGVMGNLSIVIKNIEKEIEINEKNNQGSTE